MEPQVINSISSKLHNNAIGTVRGDDATVV
jgi:hypothetical protein